MFEQDYVMRQIQQLSKALARILFNIDAESPSSFLIKDMETRAATDDLLRKIDSGNIHEAEYELSELIENRTMDNLLAGIVFYSYLNQKDDDYLETNDFSRDDVVNGIRHLLLEYGLENMADVFFL